MRSSGLPSSGETYVRPGVRSVPSSSVMRWISENPQRRASFAATPRSGRPPPRACSRSHVERSFRQAFRYRWSARSANACAVRFVKRTVSVPVTTCSAFTEASIVYEATGGTRGPRVEPRRRRAGRRGAASRAARGRRSRGGMLAIRPLASPGGRQKRRLRRRAGELRDLEARAPVLRGGPAGDHGRRVRRAPARAPRARGRRTPSSSRPTRRRSASAGRPSRAFRTCGTRSRSCRSRTRTRPRS